MLAPSLFHGVLVLNGEYIDLQSAVLPRYYMKVMNGKDVYFYGRMYYIVSG